MCCTGETTGAGEIRSTAFVRLVIVGAAAVWHCNPVCESVAVEAVEERMGAAAFRHCNPVRRDGVAVGVAGCGGTGMQTDPVGAAGR